MTAQIRTKATTSRPAIGPYIRDIPTEVVASIKNQEANRREMDRENRYIATWESPGGDSTDSVTSGVRSRGNVAKIPGILDLNTVHVLACNFATYSVTRCLHPSMGIPQKGRGTRNVSRGDRVHHSTPIHMDDILSVPLPSVISVCWMRPVRRNMPGDEKTPVEVMSTESVEGQGVGNHRCLLNEHLILREYINALPMDCVF